MTRGCTKEKYLTAFLIGFGTMLFSLLPMMLTEHGYFIYYGDGAKEVAEAIFGPSISEGVTYSEKSLSRKQILPLIKEILE